MHDSAHDAHHFRDEARRFMSLIASASGNRVLAVLVDALHRMSGESDTAWDEKHRRSALRSFGRVIRAIENGESDEARSIMEQALASALRSWERTAPDQLKQPVAWIAADS